MIDELNTLIDKLQVIYNNYEVLINEEKKYLDEYEIIKIKDFDKGIKKGLGLAINSFIKLKGELEEYFKNLDVKGDDII